MLYLILKRSKRVAHNANTSHYACGTLQTASGIMASDSQLQNVTLRTLQKCPTRAQPLQSLCGTCYLHLIKRIFFRGQSQVALSVSKGQSK